MCTDSHHLEGVSHCAGLSALLLNIFLPPIGSFVYACSVNGHSGTAWCTAITQFILLFVPFVNIGSYIWGIVYGVQIFKRSGDHHENYQKMDNHTPLVVNIQQ